MERGHDAHAFGDRPLNVTWSCKAADPDALDVNPIPVVRTFSIRAGRGNRREALSTFFRSVRDTFNVGDKQDLILSYSPAKYPVMFEKFTITALSGSPVEEWDDGQVDECVRWLSRDGKACGGSFVLVVATPADEEGRCGGVPIHSTTLAPERVRCPAPYFQIGWDEKRTPLEEPFTVGVAACFNVVGTWGGGAGASNSTWKVTFKHKQDSVKVEPESLTFAPPEAGGRTHRAEVRITVLRKPSLGRFFEVLGVTSLVDGANAAELRPRDGLPKVQIVRERVGGGHCVDGAQFPVLFCTSGDKFTLTQVGECRPPDRYEEQDDFRTLVDKSLQTALDEGKLEVGFDDKLSGESPEDCAPRSYLIGFAHTYPDMFGYKPRTAAHLTLQTNLKLRGDEERAKFFEEMHQSRKIGTVHLENNIVMVVTVTKSVLNQHQYHLACYFHALVAWVWAVETIVERQCCGAIVFDLDETLVHWYKPWALDRKLFVRNGWTEFCKKVCSSRTDSDELVHDKFRLYVSTRTRIDDWEHVVCGELKRLCRVEQGLELCMNEEDMRHFSVSKHKRLRNTLDNYYVERYFTVILDDKVLEEQAGRGEEDNWDAESEACLTKVRQFIGYDKEIPGEVRMRRQADTELDRCAQMLLNARSRLQKQLKKVALAVLQQREPEDPVGSLGFYMSRQTDQERGASPPPSPHPRSRSPHGVRSGRPGETRSGGPAQAASSSSKRVAVDEADGDNARPPKRAR